ncbi:MAG: hypothetical protein AB1492_03625 [Bacillota bacterium]
MFMLPPGTATGIGSLPGADALAALDVVLASFPDLPYWPQLPARSAAESMYLQFSGWWPGMVCREGRSYVDRAAVTPEAQARLYAAFLGEAGGPELAAVPATSAAGLYALEDRRPALAQAVAIKGHITGPISLGLTLTDTDLRPLLYDDLLMDMALKGLALSLRWQGAYLRQFNPSVVLFIDEPYLSTVGSGFFAYSRERAVAYLAELAAAVPGVAVGLHCCGNTDWTVAVEAGIAILSCDAYGFAPQLLTQAPVFDRHLRRGGSIAWGIVPSLEEQAAAEDALALTQRLEELLAGLEARGVQGDRLRRQSLLTPACGLGGQSPDGAARILGLTAAVAAAFRERHGL